MRLVGQYLAEIHSYFERPELFMSNPSLNFLIRIQNNKPMEVLTLYSRGKGVQNERLK